MHDIVTARLTRTSKTQGLGSATRGILHLNDPYEKPIAEPDLGLGW
jgi:hypothetical protein